MIQPPDEDQDGYGRHLGAGILSRLLVALVLCIVLALLCWVAAPRLGIAMPPIAPLLGFAVIAFGTIVGLWENRATSPDDDTHDHPQDEARE